MRKGYPVEFVVDEQRLLARFVNGETIEVATGDFSGPLGEIARREVEREFLRHVVQEQGWRSFRYFASRHTGFFYP